MIAHGINPDLLLLAILCKPEWTDSDRLKISENKIEFNEHFFRLAERHRVLPLLWSAHERLPLFSDGFLNDLSILLQKNQIKALQAKALQLKIQQLLDQRGVGYQFLKGIGIAERFYRDIAERHVLDLDLLMPEDQIIWTIRQLNSWGYQCEPNISSFNELQWKYFRKTHHDLYLYNNDNDSLLPIELHWQLRSPLGGFSLKPKGHFEPIDEFLYLCVHGAEHGWFRLKWLMDLPRIIHISKFDWNKVWVRAEKLTCTRHLTITLKLMDKLSISTLPDTLNLQLAKAQDQWALEYIFMSMSSEAGYNDTDKNRWKYFRYLWKLSSDKRNLNFLMNLLTTHNDWQAIPLPRAFFFLYFPLRPFIWLYRRI